MHEVHHEYHTVNHEKRVKLQHITNVQVKCENKKRCKHNKVYTQTILGHPTYQR